MSQASRRMSNSIVREALVTSVAWRLPPDSRHSRKLSIVPKQISPRPSTLAQPRHGIEQPANLRRGEIGVDHKPGALGDNLGETLGEPVLAQLGGPPVLPDDRIVQRPAARALPKDRRLALIGDPIAMIGPSAAAAASRQVATTLRQISSGSCSTHPGRG